LTDVEATKVGTSSSATQIVYQLTGTAAANIEGSGLFGDGTTDTLHIGVGFTDAAGNTLATGSTPIVRFDWSGDGNANTFSGSSGNDTFTGFAGADILTGNGGDDSFNFATGHALIGVSPGSASTPVAGGLYSSLDVITDFNSGDTLNFLSLSLASDANGTVDQGEIMAVAGAYSGGTFQVGATSGTIATLLLFDGSATAGVQLEGVVLYGAWGLNSFTNQIQLSESTTPGFIA
jgi:Ca2+-binding RTX toxin-like protein